MSRIGNLIKKAQAYKGQEFRQPKMFIPSGMIIPETAKSSMARQLYQAGVITRDDYEKMLGVVYDSDMSQNFEEDFSDEAFSTYDDEFKLSELSEYYDDYEVEPERDSSSESSWVQESSSDADGAKDLPNSNGGAAISTNEKDVVQVESHGKESKS